MLCACWVHTKLSKCYICEQLYTNITHQHCHVLHMRTAVRIRNNVTICYVRVQLYAYVTHLFRIRMNDVCTLIIAGMRHQYPYKLEPLFSYLFDTGRQHINSASPRDLWFLNTVEPQWLEHLRDHENSFDTWVVRATEGNHGTSTGSK